MLSFEKTFGLMTQTSAGYNNCLALSFARFLACQSVIISIKPRHLSARIFIIDYRGAREAIKTVWLFRC